MLFSPSPRYFGLSTHFIRESFSRRSFSFSSRFVRLFSFANQFQRVSFSKRLPRLQYSLIDNFTTHSSATACFLFRSEAKRTRHARRKSHEMRKKRPGTNVQRSGNDNSGKAEERIVLATVSNKLRGCTARRHYRHFSVSFFLSCDETTQLPARTYSSKLMVRKFLKSNFSEISN